MNRAELIKGIEMYTNVQIYIMVKTIRTTTLAFCEVKLAHYIKLKMESGYSVSQRTYKHVLSRGDI